MADPTPLQVEMRDPKSLTPYAKNSKKHPQSQIDRLAGQIAAFGFDQPIVIDVQGVIIKGHGRREAALQLGLKQVPVVVSTQDEYSNMANRIADNQVASQEYDEDMLRFDLGTLARNGMDLQLSGIETGRLEVLTAPLELGDVRGQIIGSAPAGVTRDAPAPGQVHYVSPEAAGEYDDEGGPPEGYDESKHPREENGEYRDKTPADYAPGEEPSRKRGGGLGTPVIQYALIFDTEAQQQRWYDFARWLKATYAGETLAARLDEFLEEHLGEAAQAQHAADGAEEAIPAFEDRQ